MSKHTPGPWTVAKAASEDSNNIGLTIFSLSDAEIAPARAYGDTPELMEANARLIAASPRMYERIAALAATGDREAMAIVEEVNGRSEG